MQLQCCTQHLANLSEIDIIANAALNELSLGQIVKANAMTRSGLVLLCGYFEGYIREMCNEYVEILNDAQVKSSLIPKETLSEHFEECVDLHKKQRKDKFNQAIDSLLNDLFIPLNSKRLSATNANPTVDNIEKIFSKFGIDNILDKLSIVDFSLDNMYNIESQVTGELLNKITLLSNGNADLVLELVTAIEAKWTGKTKRRRVGYLIIIDRLLDKRNKIAHGEGYVFVTPEELLEMKSNIQNLCDGLVKELELKLTNLIPQQALQQVP